MGAVMEQKPPAVPARGGASQYTIAGAVGRGSGASNPVAFGMLSSPSGASRAVSYSAGAGAAAVSLRPPARGV